MQCIGRGLLGAAPAVLAAIAVGCGGTGEARDGVLTVSAASSLTEAFRAYGESLPAEPRFSFAGSDELAAQIRQGAKPDVFASASTTYPEQLAAEGLVEEPVVFARNELVIAVAPDSPIESLGDLAGPELDVVIGAEGVPVGDYAREVLDRLPRGERAAILTNVRSEESDVKGIVGKVAQGAADAGFVYSSDVAAARGGLRAIKLPPRLEPDVAYSVAVVEGTADPDAARAFVDGLLAGDGLRALKDAGLLPPAD